ncbi:MAG: hypothetical protein LUD17_00305 [Bacteroidales bacterium]|nr:hypothetical protein [Bacteroidales bacterium]
MVPAESVEAYKAAPIWGDYQIREVDPNLGIGNINVDFDSDATIYSISGIRMGTSIDTLPAGIYIQGGKKLIKK